MKNWTRLSALQLSAAVWIVLASWLFFWLPYPTIYVIFVLPVASLLGFLFCWVVGRWLWPDGLIVKSLVARLFWPISILLTFAAPLILYLSLLHATNWIVKETGIVATPVAREVHLWDDVSDIGQQRRIYRQYRIQEPIEDAEHKLIAWTERNSPEWHMVQYKNLLSSEGVLLQMATECDPHGVSGAYNSDALFLWADNMFSVAFRFADYPHQCNLPSILPRFLFPKPTERARTEDNYDY